ncbi:DUF4174 domain-containing protein [Albimonas sp. CAU 1670]|uniref:DUF4174 domain-containing protein n=1 Tax=Albimonas sp. CAU 1670 TaxID=3032599 RepID=UPI0023DC2586|nr:DUF4174 domain-containing protein [Albimonas sp. CAU 1670]MDF2232588.1 DUF4174 domain-containing protein [Albimonas sp. CAU 1670]
MTSRRRLIAALPALALLPVVRGLPARAQADDDPLAPYLWTARPVIVFANTDRDPRFIRQMKELDRVAADLEERDVVVIVDTEPGPSRYETTDLRRKFRPHDFNVLVIGKDGEVKKRSPVPLGGDGIARLIDRLPIRQQELGRR